MVLVDGQGIPLGAQLASASPAEVTLAEATVAAVRVPCWGPGRPRQKPKRIIADRAYDSNPLRDRLQKRGIELLVPHRRNRQRWWRQDGSSVATGEDGKSSARLPGCKTSAASWCAKTAS
jgi:hypothetical protein